MAAVTRGRPRKAWNAADVVEEAAPGDDDTDEAVADSPEPEAVAADPEHEVLDGHVPEDDGLSIIAEIAEIYRADAEKLRAQVEATGRLSQLLPAEVDRATTTGQFEAAAALHGVDQRVQELSHALPSAIARAEGDVLALLQRLAALL